VKHICFQGADFFADVSAVQSLCASLASNLFPADDSRASAPSTLKKCRTEQPVQIVSVPRAGTLQPCNSNFHIRNVQFFCLRPCACNLVPVRQHSLPQSEVATTELPLHAMQILLQLPENTLYTLMKLESVSVLDCIRHLPPNL
jgi:hypothetical protein